MLKLKLQYFGHLVRRTDSLKKTLMLGKIEGRRRRGWQRMRWLDGITMSKLWGVGDGQGSLAYCSPWGCNGLDTTEWLNWDRATGVDPWRTHSKGHTRVIDSNAYGAKHVTWMYERTQGKKVVELMVNWRTHDPSRGVLVVTATLCHQHSMFVDTCPWNVSWSSDGRYTWGLPWSQW